MKTATEKLNVNKMFGGTFYLLEPQTKNTSFAELRVVYNKNGHISRTVSQFYVSFADFLATLTRVAKINTLILT